MKREASSFRDPSGFIFWHDKKLYRSVQLSYKKHYQHLMDSGLYNELVKNNLLVKHAEVAGSINFEHDHFIVIQPTQVPFISYPYEWSFSQLKDAALLTLRVQEKALEFGMTLKDASAYNVQFMDGKPIFIDTLSFDFYQKGSAWKAYKQFCQHFLAPLALMAYKDVRLSKLLQSFIDGIPLDLAASLLPKKTYFNIPLLLHIHMHAKSQKKYEDTGLKGVSKKISLHALKGILDSLKTGIEKLKWGAEGTEWVDYYQGDSYTQQGFEHKKQLVTEFVKLAQPKTVWDIGGNDGVFSRIALQEKARVISFDVDPACIENSYLEVKKNNEKNILPLILDLTNPSSSIGWDNSERTTVAQRGPADLVFALALVHHLAISNNVPLDRLAQYFAKLSEYLIIEFVPKSDKKVQKLLSSRDDIFDNYTKQGFEKAFSTCFTIIDSQQIKESDRVLYFMKKL